MATSRKPVRKKPHPTTGDLEEQRTMHQGLQRTDVYIKALMENALDGIVVLNRDGTIRYQSPFIERVLGHELGEREGKSAFEFIHPDDLPRASNLFEELQQSPGATMFEEIRVLHQDVSVRTIEIVGQNLLDSPEVAGIVANLRDITERKQGEETLRESEEKYRTILEDIEDGYYELDIAGNLTFFNDAMCGIIGYSKDEAMGMNNRQYMDEENAKKVYQAFNRVYTTGKHTKEFGWEIIRKDGTKRFIEASVSLKRNSEGEPIGFRGIVRDITERKQMEQAVRDRKEQYLALVENLSDAVFHFRDGVVVWCNDKVSQIYGHTKDDFFGKDISFFLPDETDRLKFIKEAYAVMKERGHFSGTTKAKAKDGSLVDIEYSISKIPGKYPAELVAVARDVSERKRAEETLLLKEKAIENSVSAIAMSDMEGRVTYLNRACMRFWGEANKEDLLGKPYWLLLKSDDIVKDIATAMFKNDAWEGELVAIRKNGEEVTVQVSAGMVRDEHGNPIQTISSFLDITELKKLGEEKQRMEEQLQITGRLAAVGELTAGVAHELNNPLAAVQAYAELLSDKDDLDETTKSDVETIYKEAQRASRITSNLLSFARRYKPEKGLISINDVLRKSLELHAYRMRVNNIEIVTDLDPDLPMLMADFHQMQQVFVNIITNAEQAVTEAHGRGSFHIKTQIADETIQITFTDSGPGIPEDNLKRIFDPFFTTKDVGEGTGLGLSICYGIVQEHGGHLYARSKPGQGATFVVEIPIISEDPLIGEEANSTHHLQSTPRHL